MINKLILFAFCLCLLFNCTDSREGEWITDKGGFFNAEEKKKLKRLQHLIKEKTKSEVVIYTADSLAAENVNAYSSELVRKLNLGKEGLNNGILLFACNKPQDVRIQVGLGVEWQLSDAYSRVLMKALIRNYNREHYFEGTAKALKMIQKRLEKVSWEAKHVTSGEFDNLSPDMLDMVVKFPFEKKVAVNFMPEPSRETQQFSEDYFVNLSQGLSTDEPVKLYYSKYMGKLLQQLRRPGHKEVAARVRSIDPVKLELMGVID